MVQYLPVDGFKWNKQAWTKEKILDLDDKATKGYYFEVDLKYPKELHDLHSDYPLAPENISADLNDLSSYTLELMEKQGIKTDKTKKLIPNLKDKEKYVLHYRNLKQYLNLGLELQQVHRVVEFNQSPWMKKYIDFNTDKRKGATDDFEKDLFKLMNNAVFGKTMENVRERINFVLVNDEKKAKKLAKPTFKKRTIFNEDLAGIHQHKIQVRLNKPLSVGVAILDLSKTLMYDFHYNYIKTQYGDKAKLLGTDTDSLKYVIETEDLYEEG
eukprot:Lithocolla_globosa_v1_NODE_30_length_9033_cov_22.154583.p4 type:complete len:270 gc:universal NODE_30_length_9033_cov_22.154583:5715-6524(+)